MLFIYGALITITAGFYQGQTGTVVNESTSWDGETPVYNYNIRLNVADKDITTLVPEADLEAE